MTMTISMTMTMIRNRNRNRNRNNIFSNHHIHVTKNNMLVIRIVLVHE